MWAVVGAGRGAWPCWCMANTNVIISQLVDSIIEDNLIVNVLNEAFTHRQTHREREREVLPF